MRTKAICKKTASLALAFALVAVFCMSALADTDTVTDTGSSGALSASVPFKTTITATTISITHPATINCTIDPNTNAVTVPDISIKNNSVAAVTVKITSLQGGNSMMGDELPGAKDWNNLNSADSLKFISVGLTAAASGWETGYSTTTYYSANTVPAVIGNLPAGGTGTFTLSVYHGRSFASPMTITDTLYMDFSLV